MHDVTAAFSAIERESAKMGLAVIVGVHIFIEQLQFLSKMQSEV